MEVFATCMSATMRLRTFASRGRSGCSASLRAQGTEPSTYRFRSSRRCTGPTQETACSREKGRRFTFGAFYANRMAYLAVSPPFDFELTTERFRAFGIDRTTVWHEGRLHRVDRGREVRIEVAAGGVDVEPLDAETEPAVRALLGLAFELE